MQKHHFHTPFPHTPRTPNTLTTAPHQSIHYSTRKINPHTRATQRPHIANAPQTTTHRKLTDKMKQNFDHAFRQSAGCRFPVPSRCFPFPPLIKQQPTSSFTLYFTLIHALWVCEHHATTAQTQQQCLGAHTNTPRDLLSHPLT